MALPFHNTSAILAAIFIFKKFIFVETAANFLKISRNNAFSASNTHIIKNRVEKKKLEQVLSNFNLHT